MDSSIVKNLSSFLERSSRHEALCLKSRTGDTLKYLVRCCRNCITNFYYTKVTSFQHRVFVSQFTSCNNLSGFECRRVTCIYNHFFTPDTIVFFHYLMLINHLLLKETSVSRINHFYLTHHLTYNNLEVFIIDFHTLQTVYILYFVYNILLYRSWSHDSKNIRRSSSTIR